MLGYLIPKDPVHEKLRPDKTMPGSPVISCDLFRAECTELDIRSAAATLAEIPRYSQIR